jgi:hypothetical protein
MFNKIVTLMAERKYKVIDDQITVLMAAEFICSLIDENASTTEFAKNFERRYAEHFHAVSNLGSFSMARYFAIQHRKLQYIITKA